MKRVLLALCAAALMLTALGANAAAEDAANISKVLRVKVKPGMSGPFEEALINLMKARKEIGDPWQWNVFVIIEGAGLGDYLISSEPHKWAEYDEYFARDFSAVQVKSVRSVTPLVESSMTSTMATDLDLVSWPEENPGFRFFHIYTYYLQHGAVADFRECIVKIDEARKRAGWEFHYFWQWELTGCDLPKIHLVMPRTKWADFVEPDGSLRRVLVEAYGEDGAASLMAKFNSCIRQEESFVASLRRDLGLYPEK